MIEALSENYPAAISEFTTSLKLDPAMTPALIGRANCYLTDKNLPASRQDILQAIEKSPKSPANYQALEQYCQLSGNFDAYFSELDQRLAKEPRNTTLWIAKANAYEKVLDTKKAMECFDHAIADDPNNTTALNGRGKLLQQLFKYNEAIADFSATIKLSPNDPHPFRDRATCYFDTDKDKEAVLDISRVIDLTQDPYAYAARAQCYQSMGRSEHHVRRRRSLHVDRARPHAARPQLAAISAPRHSSGIPRACTGGRPGAAPAAPPSGAALPPSSR